MPTTPTVRARVTLPKEPPICHFCHRSGNGVLFQIFHPRFEPFGTACVDCERTLPPETPAPGPVRG